MTMATYRRMYLMGAFPRVSGSELVIIILGNMEKGESGRVLELKHDL